MALVLHCTCLFSGASCNAVVGNSPGHVTVVAGGEVALVFPPASLLGVPTRLQHPHLHSRGPGTELSAEPRAAVLRLAGLALWSKETVIKKEMQ